MPKVNNNNPWHRCVGRLFQRPILCSVLRESFGQLSANPLHEVREAFNLHLLNQKRRLSVGHEIWRVGGERRRFHRKTRFRTERLVTQPLRPAGGRPDFLTFLSTSCQNVLESKTEPQNSMDCVGDKLPNRTNDFSPFASRFLPFMTLGPIFTYLVGLG